jgi:hypothetical protein
MNLIRFGIALLLLPVTASDKIPVGTVIPVMLSTSLNAAKDKPDKRIEGRVMQEITLPSGIRIKERARIFGHTVNVSNTSSGSSIVVKFTTIESEGHTFPVTVGLLAVASMTSVNDAQLPISGNSDRDPDTQWATRQIGGDIVRRGWGKVFSSRGTEGKWAGGSSVVIKLTPNVAVGCSEGPGYDREQAVWIFSSAACGTYGLRNVRIASSGIASPIGDITLTSIRNINISGGSGWMLIVTRESSEQTE